MLKEKRWEDILHLVKQKEFISIKDLSDQLNVSDMTIRRDVNYLATNGKLQKIRGGVTLIDSPVDELSTQEKIDKNVEEKKYIGTLMNSLINDGDTVFLGPGTTILYGLEHINKENITIVTNSLLVLLHVKSKYRCILTGGEFSPTTEEFLGSIADNSFTNINIDISFIATNGVYNNNVTTSKAYEGNVQNSAMKHAQINCLVIDSSKFNKADVYTFNKLSSFQYLITDWKVTEKDFAHYQEYVEILKEI